MDSAGLKRFWLGALPIVGVLGLGCGDGTENCEAVEAPDDSVSIGGACSATTQCMDSVGFAVQCRPQDEAGGSCECTATSTGTGGTGGMGGTGGTGGTGCPPLTDPPEPPLSIGSPCDMNSQCSDPGGLFLAECKEQEGMGCVCTAI